MFYGAYLLGAKILGHTPQDFQFEASWQWIEASIATIGPAFLTGCLVLGVVFSAIGYLVINSLWKYSVMFKWQQRKNKSHHD